MFFKKISNNIRITFILLVCAHLLLSGCAVHTDRGTYHIGPLLYRYQEPNEGNAYVYQTRSFPFWLEGGSQWGIGVGMQERTVMLPIVHNAESEKNLEGKVLRFQKPLNLFGKSTQDRWYLSLFYLRTNYKSEEKFLVHKVYGARVSGGKEVNAFTAGISNTTQMKPASNAIHLLKYNSSRLLTCAFVGCGNYLAFSTATKFGLDISQRADQTADIVVGYQRAEIASIPVPDNAAKTDDAKDASNKYDAYAVLGTFNVEYNTNLFDRTKKGIEINQLFATGMAAREVVKDPKMGEWFGTALGTIKKQEGAEKVHASADKPK